jgi:hypothetical protein
VEIPLRRAERVSASAAAVPPVPAEKLHRIATGAPLRVLA